MKDCPNCNKRIFIDSIKCPYCKLELIKKENNFDKELYEYLYNEYNLTKDKQKTIKFGMQKFNKSMIEIKEIIDYISNEVYNKELSKEKAIPKEELPTNEIDYSKIKYAKSLFGKSSKRKIPPLKIIGVIIYWILILLMFSKTTNQTHQIILFICFFYGIIYFAYTIIKYSKMPPPPHTYIFSLFQYFIHNLIYKIILLILLIIGLINIDNPIISIILIIALITLFFTFLYQLLKKSTERFTVEYGFIQYQHERRELFWWDGNSDENSVHANSYFTVIYYDIKNIKKIIENINSIVIFADIEKNIHMNRPGQVIKRSPKKLNKLKITKSFINNKNLVKSLQMCSKNNNDN